MSGSQPAALARRGKQEDGAVTATSSPALSNSCVLLGPGWRRSSQRPLRCLWCLSSLRCLWSCLWSCPPSPSCSRRRLCTGSRKDVPPWVAGAAASPDGSCFLTPGQWCGSCRPTGSLTSTAWCRLSAPAGWPPGSSTCSWVSEEPVCPCGGWGADTRARGCGRDSSDQPPPPLLTSAGCAGDPLCQTRGAIWTPPDPARAPIPRHLRASLQSCQATNYITLCPSERVSLSFLLLELPFKQKINCLYYRMVSQLGIVPQLQP